MSMYICDRPHTSLLYFQTGSAHRGPSLNALAWSPPSHLHLIGEAVWLPQRSIHFSLNYCPPARKHLTWYNVDFIITRGCVYPRNAVCMKKEIATLQRSKWGNLHENLCILDHVADWLDFAYYFYISLYHCACKCMCACLCLCLCMCVCVCEKKNHLAVLCARI